MATAVPTQGCLFTTVKNTSGGTKTFGFLPPHGRSLTSNEELTIFGSLYTAISRGEFVTDKRHQDACGYAVANGDLEVKESPCLILYDETDAASYTLESVAGVPKIAFVDWGSSTA